MDVLSEKAKKHKIQRFTAVANPLEMFDMRQMPMMVWDDADKQQFLLLVDFDCPTPRVLQAILLGIKKLEFDKLYRGELLYSSDLYLE